MLKINEIKARVDKGEKIHFQDEKIDCHTVAGLLRLYFRELPIPLIPFEFYQELVDLEGNKEDKMRLTCSCKSVTSKLFKGIGCDLQKVSTRSRQVRTCTSGVFVGICQEF